MSTEETEKKPPPITTPQERVKVRQRLAALRDQIDALRPRLLRGLGKIVGRNAPKRIGRQARRIEAIGNMELEAQWLQIRLEA